MKKDWPENIEKELDGAPEGQMLLRRHPGCRGEEEPGFALPADGRGKAELFSLFPGVELAFIRCCSGRILCCHEAAGNVLEINHCRNGRAGWSMKGGNAVYLGAGDLAVHSRGCCADSEMNLPLGYYEGLSLSVELPVLSRDGPALLREAGVSGESLFRKFCGSGPVSLPASRELDAVFEMLYHAPEAVRLPYYRVKAQEILLYLFAAAVPEPAASGSYSAQQAELVKEIHDLLTQNLEKRFTIEELSRRFPINASSLKAAFKNVYGMPIATYMQEYRIRQAMKLLRSTDDSIAEIAAAVGYESQSRFTGIFKKAVHLLPSDYRKLYRGV